MKSDPSWQFLTGLLVEIHESVCTSLKGFI